MIKIFKEDIELDIVRETLSISKESKYLDNDFKVQANTYPFLIVENKKTRQILGSNHPTSKNRNTYHEVTVVTPEGVFMGELQILNYTSSYRKCNLKFYSKVYSLKDKKIGDFLPKNIYANINQANPPSFNYEEKRETLIPNQYLNKWEEFGANILTKGFPQTLFNLPHYRYPDKFGEELKEDDDWFEYNGNVNGVFFDNGTRYMYSNYYRDQNGVQFINQTVNAPQVYLLAPLYKALESIGYKMAGNFTTNEFVKRILFYSEKNNLTEIKLQSLELNIPTSAINSEPWQAYGMMKGKYIQFSVTAGKKYKVEIQFKNNTGFTVTGQINSNGINASIETQLFSDESLDVTQTYSAEFLAPLTNQNGTSLVQVTLLTNIWFVPEPLTIYSLKVYEIADKTGYLSHPIIDLSRYVPEWTFIDYLNEMKKLFNLKISADDHSKTLHLNFMNDQFTNRNGVNLKDLNVDNFETLEFDSLLLSYDNEEDDSVFVNKTQKVVGKNVLKEHTKEVKSKFKFIPVDNNGCTITKQIEDKGGVGLVIFKHNNPSSSYPINSYNGYSLSLSDIYSKQYELTFKNYLSSGLFSSSYYLSKKEIKDISQKEFIITNNKRYYVNKLEYKQTPQGMYDANLELILMIY